MPQKSDLELMLISFATGFILGAGLLLYLTVLEDEYWVCIEHEPRIEEADRCVKKASIRIEQ